MRILEAQNAVANYAGSSRIRCKVCLTPVTHRNFPRHWTVHCARNDQLNGQSCRRYVVRRNNTYYWEEVAYMDNS